MLAVEVEYTQLTRENMLRHPSYRGTRDDIEITDIQLADRQSQQTGPRSAPTETIPEGSTTTSRSTTTPSPEIPTGDLSQIHMTNPDRIMYPEVGVTKLGVATHYAQVAARLLPHIVDRPLALVRCPKGQGEKCFFQKSRTKGMPDAVAELQVTIPGRNPQPAIVVRDLAGVISLVQFSALEVHSWCCRIDRPDRPDQIIFDLDPDDALPFARVVSAALTLKELLGELELETFVKTTGGKGLHVVVPIKRTLTWDEASQFALNIGKHLASHSPGRFTTSVSKAARRGKVYVDFLRNKFGATAIAPYSTRARPTASIATPIGWGELSTISGADAFTVVNLQRRLVNESADPWADMPQVKQTVTKAILRSVEF